MSAAIDNTHASESAAAAPTVMSIEQIMELFKAHRTQLAELEKIVKVALKAKGKRGIAKADKPKRAAGPWALWAKQMPLEHPADFVTFKAEKEVAAAADGKKAKGVHILFAKMWRDSHTDEWDAFSAKVKAEAPEKPVKEVKPKVVKEAKPKAETKETKPKAAKETKPKATKETKPKAAKETKPKAAPVEEEVSAELWTWKSKKYFRTNNNECWLADADGSMGAWAGVYDPVADDIDSDADEPEIEME